MFSDSLQAPRFITQPSASGSIVAEGRTKILQCQALGRGFSRIGRIFKAQSRVFTKLLIKSGVIS